MVKATKRSRKFNAKTGGAAKALSKQGSSLTKKGKTKRKTTNAKSKIEEEVVTDGKEERERERASKDFLNTENLGSMDMDSFFKQASADVANADDDESGDDDASDDDGNDDDDGSVDSYASLGSEEEDIEASELRMKEQLEKLSKKDPEFHKYLAENESELLDFGPDDDEDGEDYDEDAMEDMAKNMNDDEEDVEMGEEYAMKKTFKKQQKDAENKFLLTPDRQEQLEQSAFASHSIKGLKRIISGYRTACHLSDANAQDNEQDSDDENNEGPKKKKEFQITSPVVFDRLMAVCLVQCHEEFHYHLLKEEKGDGSESSDDEEEQSQLVDENKPIHPKNLSKSPNWPALRPLIESFLKSTLHILSESGKEAKLLQFVLSALSKYVPYLTAFPKLGKPFLKTTVNLWSAPLDTSEDYNSVRLQAFLRIRQLAITQPYPFIEETLKLTYLSYAKRSKFGTAANVTSVLPTLTFMGNCVVELYSLDYASAYQHAFVYVRQLALHLRSAYMKQTPESKAMVCCWQYVHCLKLWTAVLCAACSNKGGDAGGQDASSKLGGGVGKDEEANMLRSLVYPLTEIILGLCRLVPVAQFVPLRLHCVRLLQQLASSTETYIPTTSLLMGVLDFKEVGMKPLRDGKGGKNKNKSGGSVRGLRLPLILKLPKEGTLRTMEQLDNVLKELFVLLNREVDLYRYSPGFPEFTYAVTQRLRKFNKEISNGRWRAYSKGTMELCEKYSTFATNGRATLADAPKDVRRLEALKPTNTPSMRDRYESAVAKEKRLEAATQPVMKKGFQEAVKAKKKEEKRKRKAGDDSDNSDVEEEEQKEKPKPKKKKKKKVVNQADLRNVEALKEEDEVQEGIAWSDSESD